MLNKLLQQLKQSQMVAPGERVYCAVSGGADSVALLWGLYLLKDQLGFALEAVHFNHRLRGEESHRDEEFVRNLCARYDIPITVGSGNIVSGSKGLEAAAREARYAFFATLPGKIATAHTADDNAETVLMHLVRGTGLKGLCGIRSVRGNVIRPMLGITRQEVLAFLQEQHLTYVEDSTNAEDAFLRNRLRHHVMPLLKAENPSLAQNLSAMAAHLCQDAQLLEEMARYEELPTVEELRNLHPAIRSRMLERFLKEQGVPEPEAQHIALAERLVFSDKPSAAGNFPGGVVIRRNYDRLEAAEPAKSLQSVSLPLHGQVQLDELGLRVVCTQAQTLENSPTVFTVDSVDAPVLRSRQEGDSIRLKGGTKTLKKLLIDRKIPVAYRDAVAVIADNRGVVGVYGIGADESRKAKELPAWQIRFEPVDLSDKL